MANHSWVRVRVVPREPCPITAAQLPASSSGRRRNLYGAPPAACGPTFHSVMQVTTREQEFTPPSCLHSAPALWQERRIWRATGRTTFFAWVLVRVGVPPLHDSSCHGLCHTPGVPLAKAFRWRRWENSSMLPCLTQYLHAACVAGPLDHVVLTCASSPGHALALSVRLPPKRPPLCAVPEYTCVGVTTTPTPSPSHLSAYIYRRLLSNVELPAANWINRACFHC